MLLYVQLFGLTELRLYATAFMVWLGGVFVWLAWTVLRGARARFAFGALVQATAVLAGLHVVNPDALITRVNARRTVAGAPFDAAYAAGTLSADAVPALLEVLPQLAPPERGEVARRLLARWGAPPARDWRSWNWSAARARALVGARAAELDGLLVSHSSVRIGFRGRLGRRLGAHPEVALDRGDRPRRRRADVQPWTILRPAPSRRAGGDARTSIITNRPVAAEPPLMSPRIVQVDAFTASRSPATPRPSACSPTPPTSAWMQQRRPRDEPLGDGASWFARTTPGACAGSRRRSRSTCADTPRSPSAHVLWEDGHLHAGAQARFDTKSGRLTADQRGDWIEMDFPAEPAQPAEPRPELAAGARRSQARYVGKNRMDYLVEVESEADVRGVAAPTSPGSAALPVRGIIVTARAVPQRLRLRLALLRPRRRGRRRPRHRLRTLLSSPPIGARSSGKAEMTGRQASARGGVVRVRVRRRSGASSAVRRSPCCAATCWAGGRDRGGTARRRRVVPRDRRPLPARGDPHDLK